MQYSLFAGPFVKDAAEQGRVRRFLLAKQDDVAFKNGAQLSDIAGPGMGGKFFENGRADDVGRFSVLVQKGREQVRDILQPMPQGRDLQAQAGQTVKEVRAKIAFLDHFRKGFVRCADDAYVDRDDVASAHTDDLACF